MTVHVFKHGVCWFVLGSGVFDFASLKRNSLVGKLAWFLVRLTSWDEIRWRLFPLRAPHYCGLVPIPDVGLTGGLASLLAVASFVCRI